MKSGAPHRVFSLTNPPQRRDEDLLKQEAGEDSAAMVIKTYLELADRAIGSLSFPGERRRGLSRVPRKRPNSPWKTYRELSTRD
jgi:hypothetical protein